MPPTLFLRLSGARRRNLAMFRSPGLNYYHGAIHPDWPDIETTIRKQCKIKADCVDATELYCMGTSMGGYAAMLFGHYLEADTVYAFGAQSLINMDGVNTDDEGIPMAHRDLSELLSDWNGRTCYKMFYNEGFEPDRIAAERMADCPGVELIPMPGNTHNVLKEPGRRKMLSDLLPPL